MKSENVRGNLDSLSQSIFGRPRSEALQKGICVKCGEKADKFNDQLSRREYGISGFCQKCQDDIFGGEEG